MATTSMGSSTKGLIIENPNATRIFELDKLNLAIDNVDQMLAHRRQMPREKSDEMYYELVKKYLIEYRDAKVNGNPIVLGRGKEILHAMGMVPYSSMPVAVAIAQTQGLQQEVLSAANEAGMRTFLCAPVGRFAWGGIVRGFMLPPDLIVGDSYYCNTMAIGFEFWAHWLGVPYYRMDRPYKYSEEGVQYYAKGLENMIKWLEEQTGRKMDWDKLRENVEYQRQLLELRAEIAQLRKAVPHPMRSRHSSHLEIMDFYWGGRPEAVAYYRQVRDEIKERIAQKKGYVENERLRLLCMYLPPTHALGILDWWEREWGAVSVAEPWFTYSPRPCVMDPRKPLESLARLAFYGRECTYFGTAGEEIIDDFVWYAQEYAVDGAVWYAPNTCMESNPLIQCVKDALKKKANIPMLVVDVDYVDPTYVSEEEIRDKTEPFFEMLCERKGV